MEAVKFSHSDSTKQLLYFQISVTNSIQFLKYFKYVFFLLIQGWIKNIHQLIGSLSKMANVKTKKIAKQSTQLNSSQTPSQTPTKAILKGKKGQYEIGKIIYEKPSKKGKVCVLLQTNTKKEFIGKYVVHHKQHQVIFQCHFLNVLNSKSICKFIELIRAQEGYWIVIEKAKCSLLDYLPQIKPQDVRIILQNIAKAYLVFFNQNISHRDIKLSNLVIDNEEKKTIKIIDLQLCEKKDHVYGTSEFVPPQIRLIDWSVCDSYAFGKIAEKLCDVCKYEDQDIRQLITKCTHKERQSRWTWEHIYQTLKINVQKPIQDLEQLVQNSPPQVICKPIEEKQMEIQTQQKEEIEEQKIEV